MSEPTDKPAQPTREQIIQMKENMLKYYKEEVEFLTAQANFEELQMRVTEARARRAKAEVILAQIYAPQEDPETKEEAPAGPGPAKAEAEVKDPGIRKLKVEVTEPQSK